MSYTTEDKIGLVIKSAESMAKCMQIIRKYNPISMAEIKKAIDAGHFVFDCDYIDDSGIRRVRRCYDELVKAGVKVDIYEDGDLTTREFISNLLGTYKEIATETEAIIDAEVSAEDGYED
ncbi:MAG: hypothetical protein J5525_10175 [Lachnospiraceae bacterium]|nr:hypothetical protein [Lachnospiraceae bacterium]